MFELDVLKQSLNASNTTNNELQTKLNASETKYLELHGAARECWRYYGVDNKRFDLAMRRLDSVIQYHLQQESDED